MFQNVEHWSWIFDIDSSWIPPSDLVKTNRRGKSQKSSRTSGKGWKRPLILEGHQRPCWALQPCKTRMRLGCPRWLCLQFYPGKSKCLLKTCVSTYLLHAILLLFSSVWMRDLTRSLAAPRGLTFMPGMLTPYLSQHAKCGFTNAIWFIHTKGFLLRLAYVHT